MIPLIYDPSLEYYLPLFKRRLGSCRAPPLAKSTKSECRRWPPCRCSSGSTPSSPAAKLRRSDLAMSRCPDERQFLSMALEMHSSRPGEWNNCCKYVERNPFQLFIYKCVIVQILHIHCQEATAIFAKQQRSLKSSEGCLASARQRWASSSANFTDSQVGGNPNAWGYPGCFAGKSHLWMNTFLYLKKSDANLEILRTVPIFDSSFGLRFMFNGVTMWRFPNGWGYPKSSKLHHFSIENPWFCGSPILRHVHVGCQSLGHFKLTKPVEILPVTSCSPSLLCLMKTEMLPFIGIHAHHRLPGGTATMQ